MGLGEVLASANEEGNPYRIVYNKDSGHVTISEFANYSFAFRPDPSASINLLHPLDKAKRCRVNYTEVKYSMNEEELKTLGKRLGEIATIIENHYKGSQDIEGAISNNEVYIVQTRPQV